MQSNLGAPLLEACEGARSGSSSGSPLPPSASKSSRLGELGANRSSEWGGGGGIEEGLALHSDGSNQHSSPESGADANQRASVAAAPVSWMVAFGSAVPIALMNLVQAVSQAQLMCLGTNLDAPTVAAMQLLGLAVAQSVFLCASGIPRYAIATPDVTVGILAQCATEAVYGSSALSDASKTQTALVALGMVTVVQGLLYYALGQLRASNLVRYLPYPVVCGFLGVVGLCICSGALGVAGFDVAGAGAPSLSFLGDLLHSAGNRPAQLAAVLIFALANFGVASRTNFASASLLVVPAALLLFYGFAGFVDTDPDELARLGWLGVPSPREHSVVHSLWASRDFRLVSWRDALPDTQATVCRLLVALMALVLKVLAIEDASGGAAVGVDRELRVAGVANVACGLVGGCLANHSALYVGPLRRVGRSDRRVPSVVLAITLCALPTFGVPLMDMLPRFVLGGLLLSLGLRMLRDWVWASRRQMDRSGYAALLGIVCSAVLAGSTSAIFLALLTALASSHLRMSRLPTLKYHITGAAIHARVSRPQPEQLFLTRHGGAIHILGLDGFLGEGTTARLLRHVLRAPRPNAAWQQGYHHGSSPGHGRHHHHHHRYSPPSVGTTSPHSNGGRTPDAPGGFSAADVSPTKKSLGGALSSRSGPPMQFLILDMTMCQDVDPSACALLGRASRTLAERNVQLVLSCVPPSVIPPLVNHGVLHHEATLGSTTTNSSSQQQSGLSGRPRPRGHRLRRRFGGLSVLPDSLPLESHAEAFGSLDEALAWCEDELLELARSNQIAAEYSTSRPDSSLTHSPAASSFASGWDSRDSALAVSDENRSAVASAGGPGSSSTTAAGKLRARTLFTDGRAAAASPANEAAPFAPSASLPPAVWTSLVPFGVAQQTKVGEVLTSRGSVSGEIFVAPSSGVTIELRMADESASHGSSSRSSTAAASVEPLATLRHGGVFGAQGALLGVPSLITARVVAVERGATLLMLGGTGLAKLRSVQPALERRLLASAAEQQQQLTATLERRSALWRGGGWRGPDVVQ